MSSRKHSLRPEHAVVADCIFKSVFHDKVSFCHSEQTLHMQNYSSPVSSEYNLCSFVGPFSIVIRNSALQRLIGAFLR